VSSKTQKTTDKMINEITYTNSNESQRGRMSRYHSSPQPREMHKGAKNTDIANKLIGFCDIPTKNNTNPRK